MTNEKNREDAKGIVDKVLGACEVGYSYDTQYVDCTRSYIDPIIADEIGRIRAEAVKAEREALRAIDAWWRLPNEQRTIEAIEPAMRLVVSILSDDQEAEVIEMPGEAPPVVVFRRFEHRSGVTTDINDKEEGRG